MNVDQKKKEIERIEVRLKNEGVLKEIAVYVKALKERSLKKIQNLGLNTYDQIVLCRMEKLNADQIPVSHR